MFGKYFVGCDSESAEQIYFSWNDAKDNEHKYIAIFDDAGLKLAEFKRMEDGLYSDDF